MQSLKTRKTMAGLAFGAALAVAWYPPTRAQEPPAPQEVKFTDDGTCHSPATTTETITPGAGKVRFYAPENCALRTMPTEKAPKVSYGASSLAATPDAYRRTFDVEYTLPTDKHACLTYSFTLTPADSTSAKGPGAGTLCNGIP